MTVYVRQDDRNRIYDLRAFLKALPKAVFDEALDEEYEPVRIGRRSFLASTVLKECDEAEYAREYDRWLDSATEFIEEFIEDDALPLGQMVDLSDYIPSPFAIAVYLCDEKGGCE